MLYIEFFSWRMMPLFPKPKAQVPCLTERRMIYSVPLRYSVINFLSSKKRLYLFWCTFTTWMYACVLAVMYQLLLYIKLKILANRILASRRSDNWRIHRCPREGQSRLKITIKLNHILLQLSIFSYKLLILLTDCIVHQLLWWW